MTLPTTGPAVRLEGGMVHVAPNREWIPSTSPRTGLTDSRSCTTATRERWLVKTCITSFSRLKDFRHFWIRTCAGAG